MTEKENKTREIPNDDRASGLTRTFMIGPDENLDFEPNS